MPMHPPLLPVLAACALAACDGSPAAPIDPEPPLPPGTGRLVIAGPSALVVHESALYTAWWSFGTEWVRLSDTSVRWSSSNPAVVQVDSGVAVAAGRGSADLSATMGGLVTTLTVEVRGRLRLVAEGVVNAPSTWALSTGDTLHLDATLTDVDGVLLPDRPTVTWTSSNGAVASVSQSGVVVGIAPGQVVVRATSDDGTASLTVDVGAGAWPTVHILHAAESLGGVMLTFSSGRPATVSFGEVLTRVVPPGDFIATAASLPSGGGYMSWRTVSVRLRPHQQLTIFVVGNYFQAFLAHTFSDTSKVAPGMGRIRLVQGWNPYPIVYLRSPGGEPIGIPELCYFDPADVSRYYVRPAGPVDILLAGKYGPQIPVARLPATVPDGKSVTYVLTGDRPGTMGLLAFPDP